MFAFKRVQPSLFISLVTTLACVVQVSTLRQALHIKAGELSKQAGSDIHSRLLYAVAKVSCESGNT